MDEVSEVGDIGDISEINVINEVDWEGFMSEFQPMLDEKHEALVTSQNQNIDDLLEINNKK